MVQAMNLPSLDEFELTSLAWKEWLQRGNKSEFKSKAGILRYIEQCNDKERFKNFSGIKNYVRHKQIRKLLNGYALLDLLYCSDSIYYERFKMWRLFEDLIGEIFAVALRKREECKVVHVDKWPGFQGLDYIIVNSEDKLGWRVGVQCKEYIGSKISYNQLDRCSSHTRKTNATGLHREGLETRNRFPRRKLVLVAFNAYRENKTQEKRFRNLEKVWDAVIVLDDNKSDDSPYIYKLRCSKLYDIVDWC